jgi:ArsR family transcriptional regulator
MDLLRIYQCLCDRTRLRLLNLLHQGPLCVCHFQKILREPQVKISKHLAYLRARGLVTMTKDANWRIYALPARPSRELAANLRCLQDCLREDPVFQRDSARLRQLHATFTAASPACTPAACKSPCAC